MIYYVLFCSQFVKDHENKSRINDLLKIHISHEI